MGLKDYPENCPAPEIIIDANAKRPKLFQFMKT